MFFSEDHAGCPRSTLRSVMAVSLAVVFLLSASNSLNAQCPREIAHLTASDSNGEENFGLAVAISGDLAVIGVEYDDDNGQASGSAYVFRWDGLNWIEEAKLLASDGSIQDNFGNSVSVSGNVVVVGSVAYDGVGTNSGAAYVFRWDGIQWTEEAKLMASDSAAGDELFGISVSISEETILIGARDYDSENGSNAGAAYVFHWVGSKWVEQAILHPSDADSQDKFGQSVALSGDLAVIGASTYNDEHSFDGAAYLFRWNGLNWSEEVKLIPWHGGNRTEGFGNSVAVSGDFVLVGAPSHHHDGVMTGAAYGFQRNGDQWVEQGELLASDGTADDRFGGSVGISNNVAVVGAKYHGEYGENSGMAYIYRWDGIQWRQKAKCLASDGATWDRLGGAVSVSGDVALIGAPGHDHPYTDSGGAYVFSTIYDDVRIYQQPEDLITPRGEQACFSVVTEDGAGEILYQWRRNGQELTDGGKISGSNTDTLCINNVAHTDEGFYDVVITDDCVFVVSDPAELHVVDPQLDVVPTCPDGGPITVTWTNAYPGGDAALLYARRTGGVIIPGGNPCAGTQLGLGTTGLRIAWQGYAGDDGTRVLNGSAPAGACGGYMQLIDLTTCTTSNVVHLQ